MIVVDDVLLFPIKGLFFVFREIHNAALEELRGEAASVREQLAQLYLRLETGELSEADFDDCESQLLDRLDELEAILGGEEPDDPDDLDSTDETNDED